LAKLSDCLFLILFIVGGTPTTLGTDPVDVLGVVLDVAGLAVETVLGLDHQSVSRNSIFSGNVFINAWNNRELYCSTFGEIS
jgi:hypothetical protein